MDSALATDSRPLRPAKRRSNVSSQISRGSLLWGSTVAQDVDRSKMSVRPDSRVTNAKEFAKSVDKAIERFRATQPMDQSVDVLRLAGTIDISAADRVRRILLDHLQTAPSVRLDLSAVDALDAAGFQLLFSMQRSASLAGKLFTVQGFSSTLQAGSAALGIDARSLYQGHEAFDNLERGGSRGL